MALAAPLGAVSTVVGAALVVVVLHDIFRSLFHPAGSGRLSMLAFRGLWRVTGRIGEPARAFSGPLALVLVVVSWAVVLVVGWALIYWPALPGGFVFATSLDPAEHEGLLTAMYVSWVTQATLGYGDIAPADDVLQILAPVQASIGFAVFTAAVAWVLSIYPALHRQRSTASFATAIREGNHALAADVGELAGSALASQMRRLTQMLASIRVDYLQYPATFYFAPPAESLSLAATLPYAAALAEAETSSGEARVAAAELGAALDELTAALDDHFLGGSGTGIEERLHLLDRHHALD